MSEVQAEGLAKRYGEAVAVGNVSFVAPTGSFLSLLGPSGCGKTTTLRMISGFERPDSGSIMIDGVPVNEVPPWRRNLGVVFQSYALFPFLTVSDNVAFGLKRRGVPNDELRRRVGEALELVNLVGLDGRYPRQLSGGQQQRVALARALVINPRVLLLDEPLSNLDAKLRGEMRAELKRIQREAGVTTIFVTHDQEEALSLSDQILLMNRGAVAAAGSPRELWESPGSRFVADFLGVQNLLPARVEGPDVLRLANTDALLRAPARGGVPAGRDVVVAIRSHDIGIGLAQSASHDDNPVPGKIVEASYQGAAVSYRVATPLSPQPLLASAAADIRVGENVWLTLPASKLMLLRPDETAA